MEHHGARVGSLVGAVAGLVFVLVNSGGLPGAPVLRTAGVLAFVAALVAIIRSTVVTPPPTPEAGRTYAVCVVAMVIAVPVGAVVITRVLDEPDLVLCWVVLVVGAHFVPFARAFSAPVFRILGLVLVAVGVVGGVGVLAGLADAQLWAGVVAGFVLLAAADYGARGDRRTAQDRSRE